MSDTEVGASAPKLDDLMLAMDVVDTLRHDQRLVERELSADASDEALIKRLREVYKGQGIEVPDRVLEEGVKALKEKRFSYEPPRPSLARSLALLWIGRARTGKILLGAFLALLAAWLAYDFFVVRPQRLAQRQAAAEIAEILPRTLASSYADVLRETKVDAATQYAARLLADGKAALARGDAAGARKAAADMEVLLGDLRAEFGPAPLNHGTGKRSLASIFWRTPDEATCALRPKRLIGYIEDSTGVLNRQRYAIVGHR
jgi:Family of unknown function (DUF6384)